MEDNVVPLVAVIVIFGLPVGGWILVRLMAHRERMAMLQHGIMPPSSRGFWRHGGTEGWTAAPGTPMRPCPDVEDAQMSLNRGIKTSMIGLALLIGLSFIGYSTSGPFGLPSWHPGPWLLGGLIPLFVGLAQILIALTSGARFGLAPPPDRFGPRAAAAEDGSGVAGETPRHPGRPGVTYEELPRPARPPDRR